MAEKKSQHRNKVKIDHLSTGILGSYNLSEWQEEVQRDAQQNLISERELRFRDIYWKLTNRNSLKIFLMALLVCQNIVVFLIVIYALLTNKLDSLQLVFSTLVGGTLLETASAIYVMTRWLFSDIKYDKQALHQIK